MRQYEKTIVELHVARMTIWRMRIAYLW